MDKKILYTFLFGIFTISCFSQSISLDLTYGTNGYTDPVNITTASNGGSVLMSDNKLIIGYTPSSPSNIHLKKYNTNGSVDTTFGTNGIVTFDNGLNTRELISKIVLQNDGKILVVGKYYSDPGSLQNYDVFILRLNNNGTRDTTFGSNGFVFRNLGTNWDRVIDVSYDSDGNIYLLGIAGNSPFQTTYLLKYSSTGVLDTTFESSGVITLPLSGADFVSKIFVGANSILLGGVKTNTGNNIKEIYLEKRDLNGSYIQNFGNSGVKTITDLNYQLGVADFAYDGDSDSMFILSDIFSIAGGVPAGLLLAKIAYSDGTFVNPFGNSGVITYSNVNLFSPTYSKLLLLPNQELIVGGISRLNDGNNQFEIIMSKFSMDSGIVDLNFGTSGLYRPVNSSLQENVITGFFKLPNGEILLTATGYFASVPDKVYSSKHKNAYTLSSESLSLLNEVFLHPNPTHNILNLDFDESQFRIKTIKIYNSLGMLISKDLNVTKSIDVSQLSSGVYFLEIISSDNEKRIQKFVKN